MVGQGELSEWHAWSAECAWHLRLRGALLVCSLIVTYTAVLSVSQLLELLYFALLLLLTALFVNQKLTTRFTEEVHSVLYCHCHGPRAILRGAVCCVLAFAVFGLPLFGWFAFSQGDEACVGIPKGIWTIAILLNIVHVALIFVPLALLHRQDLALAEADTKAAALAAHAPTPPLASAQTTTNGVSASPAKPSVNALPAETKRNDNAIAAPAVDSLVDVGMLAASLSLPAAAAQPPLQQHVDRKSTRLNSSHT